MLFENVIIPMDPPAEIEQYSNSPSNTGQSSPTLSGCETTLISVSSEYIEGGIRTLVLLLHKRVHVDRCYPVQEFDVFVRVKLCHFSFRGGFGALITRV